MRCRLTGGCDFENYYILKEKKIYLKNHRMLQKLDNKRVYGKPLCEKG